MSAPRLRVLQSFPRPRPTTNPYLSQLAEALSREVEVHTFDWRTALTTRYDVLHVHWPEVMLRGRTAPRALVRQAAVAVLLMRTALTRTAVVRTVHNTAPHEGVPALSRALMRWFDRRTALWIRLNPATPTPPGAPAVTILHGHYRDWFARQAHPEVVPGTLLFFGLVRPYKGIEALLAAFAALPDRAPDAGLRLRVVGSPTGDALPAQIAAAADADPRVTARLEYVPDDALAEEIGHAELVVLPYREMHNSGAALLALSLDRPVLVPAGAPADALAAEVGPGWVTTFDGTLGPDDLRTAVAAARSPRSTRPDLGAREWEPAAVAHLAAYRTAVAAVRGHRNGGSAR